MGEITTATFCRKSSDVWHLLSDDLPSDSGVSPIEVTKVIELSVAEYCYFANHLLEDAPFIAANKDLMSYNDKTGITRCLLITAQSARGGILVDSQGFDYARYAAYVPDKSRLKLPKQPEARQGRKHHKGHSGLNGNAAFLLRRHGQRPCKLKSIYRLEKAPLRRGRGLHRHGRRGRKHSAKISLRACRG